ncbi:MAG: tRNA (adenosine(37)-N6)-dimethylallyltransferase MiaA [Candidatus Cybelea sp.]
MSNGDAVLIIAGSTASGKTELAIELAREFDAEIVGADSRQIYRDMPVGTAAPSPEQRRAVPHHLIEFLDPRERYSAARYASDALDAIGEIRGRGKRAIVAGGTGFYIRALTGGVTLAPQYDEALRSRLAQEARLHGPEFLHGWLERRDPARARALGANDTYRVLRALEIALAAPAAAVRSGAARTLATQGLRGLLVFLDLPWSVIDERIAARTQRMLASGLIDEAQRLGSEAVAANAVGFPQALAHLRGWSTEAELRAALERATRRYARRQRAWFRGEPETVWIAPARVRALVREKLGWSEKRA